MDFFANAVKRGTLELFGLPDAELQKLDPTKYLINPDFTAVNNVPRYYWIIDGDQLREMTESEKNAVDVVQRPTSLLRKITSLDRKTQRIIEAGFTHNNLTFSLSQPAQATWTLLKLSQLSGTLVYPVAVATIDDQIYEIQDQAEFIAFTTALDTAVVTALSVGRALKEQVKALQHSDQIDAFVDPRN